MTHKPTTLLVALVILFILIAGIWHVSDVRGEECFPVPVRIEHYDTDDQLEMEDWYFDINCDGDWDWLERYVIDEDGTRVLDSVMCLYEDEVITGVDQLIKHEPVEA